MGKKIMSREQWKALAQAAGYDVNCLAGLCNLSNRQLRRILRVQLGYSPREWLTQQRILAAQCLLLSGCAVKVVALELGYKQTSHFCRNFKSFVGLTPMEFTQLHAPDSSMAVRDNICPDLITPNS